MNDLKPSSTGARPIPFSSVPEANFFVGGKYPHPMEQIKTARETAGKVWAAMYPDRRKWEDLELATQNDWQDFVLWVRRLDRDTDPDLWRQRTAQDVDSDGWVEGLVRVEINELIRNDLEGFLDILSERLTGSGLLADINYSVQGCDGPNDEVVLLVSGDASQCFRDDDE